MNCCLELYVYVCYLVCVVCVVVSIVGGVVKCVFVVDVDVWCEMVV